MAGGLFQIVSYGSQDIFLTGTPQITFFKIIYRRHTNFAIESVQQHFIGIANFGEEMTSVVEKVGDLMSRVYLEIEIPKVNLSKNYSQWKNTLEHTKAQLDKIQHWYNLVSNYIKANIDVARNLMRMLNCANISMDEIENIIGNDIFNGNVISSRNLIEEYIMTSREFRNIDEYANVNSSDILQQIRQLDIILIARSIISKSQLKSFITKQYYNILYDFYIRVYNLYNKTKTLYQSMMDGTHQERYKFAWVEELGHAIIDKLDIKIGNQTIDTHTGDWLIIYNKLFLHQYQVDNYYKMIGNVPELTVFDDSIKNSYKLIIPFQFWFCRNTGLSLPLVALRYHDVIFTVKLKDLEKLCYVEEDNSIMDIPNLQSQYNINIIDAKLYIDYIYLDSDERRRFAQSSHEYLIETVQYNEIEDIIGKQHNTHLNFSHPTKFIAWFVQPKFYRENPTGNTKCQWNNYGIHCDKTGYTTHSSYLRLNSYNRTDPDLDMKYYNCLQPYWHFARTPTDGLYVYSFAIKPTMHQPSGTINLSRIDDFGIVQSFTDEFINLINNNDSTVYMAAYIMSYNVLRIMSGMGGTAFK